MAKDDYFVIVYQVLKYLYDTLKQGYQPDPDKLTADYLGINRYYWGYIIQSLLDEGFIKGVKIIPTKDGLVASRFEGMQITPKGIQYLFDNSLMEKVKDIAPLL